MPSQNPYDPPKAGRPRYKFVPALPTWLGAICCLVLSLAFATGFAVTLAGQLGTTESITAVDVFVQVSRMANALLLGGLAVALLKGYRRLAVLAATIFLLILAGMLTAFVSQGGGRW